MLPNGRQSSERFIKALLWLIARQYTGFNNGMLKATLSLMQEWEWKKKLLYKCRNELVKYDWIRVCRAQHFHKQSILYALSWLDADEPSSHVRFDDGARSQKNVHCVFKGQFSTNNTNTRIRVCFSLYKANTRVQDQSRTMQPRHKNMLLRGTKH